MKNKSLLEEEKEFYLYIIDLLASEYGWSIEYIQDLSVPEIMGLVHKIVKRKDIQDQMTQLNIAKAINGKISSNYKDLSKPSPEVEVKNLEKLSGILGIPLKKDQEDGS